jgi:predicted nucleic acid-binding Zn ribbon protein
MKCPFCDSTTRQYKNGFQASKQRYLCAYCSKWYTSGTKAQTYPNNTCIQCGNATDKEKFCSPVCAESHYKASLQRKNAKRIYHCKCCGVPIALRRTTCDACNQNLINWETYPIGKIRHKTTYQVNAQVRQLARRIYANAKLPEVCRRCGYDKHVEICHLRGISTFPDETPIAVINRLENLVALCPNCHWELDHGLLNPAEISKSIF